MAELDQVQGMIDEADKACANPRRGISDSKYGEMFKVLAGGSSGAALGGAASFAALYALGTTGLSAAGITSGLAALGALVGGGMVAGIFVFAAPVVAAGAGGVWLMQRRNFKLRLQRKEKMLQDAIRARDAIVRELESEVSKARERMDLLNGLNAFLQRAVNDLKADLKAATA